MCVVCLRSVSDRGSKCRAASSSAVSQSGAVNAYKKYEIAKRRRRHCDGG